MMQQPQHLGLRQQGLLPPQIAQQQQQQQIRMQQIQMQQQQQQQQQQGFRMQQHLPTRPPMTPTQVSGEPIRPNFPPQQPVSGASDAMRHLRPVGPAPQTTSFTGGHQTSSTLPINQQQSSVPQMAPPIRGTLRLSIPPQQQLIPGSQPRTPGAAGAFGSQQPSPSLTPRSEDGESGNSSRGQTPAPVSAEMEQGHPRPRLGGGRTTQG